MRLFTALALIPLLFVPSARSAPLQGAVFGCWGSGSQTGSAFDPNSTAILVFFTHVYDGVCDLIEDGEDGGYGVQESCQLFSWATASNFTPPQSLTFWYSYPDGTTNPPNPTPITLTQPKTINFSPVEIQCGKELDFHVQVTSIGKVTHKLKCSYCWI